MKDFLPWWAMSGIIFIQCLATIIYKSSFACTTDNDYTLNYKRWNLWFALLIGLEYSQNVVDIIWILVYNETYFEELKNYESAKATSEQML